MVGNTILVPPRSAFKSREELCAFVSYKMRRATEMFTFKCSLYQRELKLYLPEPVPKHRRWIDTFDSESIVTIPMSKIEKDEIDLFRKYYPEDMDLDSMFPGDLLQRSFKKRISSLLTSLVNKIVFLLVLKHDTWYVHQEARDGLREYLVNSIWPKQPKMRLLYRDHVTTFVDTRIRHFRDSVGRYFRDLQANSKNSEFVNSLIVTCDYKQSELDEIINKALHEQKYYFEKESNTEIVKSALNCVSEKSETVECKSALEKCDASTNGGDKETDKIVVRNISECKNLIQTIKLTENFEINKESDTATNDGSCVPCDETTKNIGVFQNSRVNSNPDLETTDLTSHENDLDIINNSSCKIINTIFDKLTSSEGVKKSEKQQDQNNHDNLLKIRKMMKRRDSSKKKYQNQENHYGTYIIGKLSDKELIMENPSKLEKNNVTDVVTSAEKRTKGSTFDLEEDSNSEGKMGTDKEDEHCREDDNEDYKDEDFGDCDDDYHNLVGDNYSDCGHEDYRDKNGDHEKNMQKYKYDNFDNLDFGEFEKTEKNDRNSAKYNKFETSEYKEPPLKKKRVGVPDNVNLDGNGKIYGKEINNEKSRPFNVSTSSISSNITLSADSVLSTSSLRFNSNSGLHNSDSKGGNSPKQPSMLNYYSLFQPLPSSIVSLYEQSIKSNQNAIYEDTNNPKSSIVYRNIKNEKDSLNYTQGNYKDSCKTTLNAGFNPSNSIGNDYVGDSKNPSSNSIDNVTSCNKCYFTPANIPNKFPLNICLNHILNNNSLVNVGFQYLNQGINLTPQYCYIPNYSHLVNSLNNGNISQNLNSNFNNNGFGFYPISTSIPTSIASSLTTSYSPSYYSVYPLNSYFTQPNIYNVDGCGTMLNGLIGSKANQRFKYN
ncbi:hypothetical protein FG386_002281 [Cryptosporidium ryanae]|uniref:uncharacterized protein n=1 Tax=Cryptosporidium ryanae TaxID=515981 RepID=UPI00351AA3F7|nr:hypothetical protein FG386_002281 [Cryptosporidium ryanae]